MKINIVNSYVVRLSITSKEEGASVSVELAEASKPKGKAKFATKVEFEDNSFFVVFKLELTTDDDEEIKVVYRSRFETDSDIDEKFKRSSFPYVNAPAIAYPYLRAYISNLTLNSGYSPIMLPSVNFVALKEKVMAESI